MLEVVQESLHISEKDVLHYVGDSALITRENLDTAKRMGIVITGRLPRTVNACGEVVTQALSAPEKFQELGKFSEHRFSRRPNRQFTVTPAPHFQLATATRNAGVGCRASSRGRAGW